MSTLPETWAKRFGAVALINALISLVWAIFPLFVDQNISRYIAGGSVGTWGYLGFLALIVGGFAGMTSMAFLYYIIPKTTGSSINNILAWLNLALLEVGILGLSTLLGYAGYIGGKLLYEKKASEIHQAIVWTVDWNGLPTVAVFLGLAGLGALLGIVALLLTFRGKKA